jgi:putative FmdB family regulatory protein
VPTYDYQCRQCGHTIEVIHSMQESGPESCERCGGELRRVFFPAGIIFKGSGFYKTDSRSAGSGTSTSPSAAATKPAAGEPRTAATTGDAGGDGSSGSSAPAKEAPKKESA